MRAKFIYEAFSEKGDPIKNMGIGSIALIHKWFKTYAPNVKYTVDDDLNIKVKGSLYLYGTSVRELPDNLSVEGALDLERSDIRKLPDNLSVGRNLYLYGTSIRELPDNLSVGGDLWLQGTKIRELPKSLKVNGTIYKDF